MLPTLVAARGEVANPFALYPSTVKEFFPRKQVFFIPRHFILSKTLFTFDQKMLVLSLPY